MGRPQDWHNVGRGPLEPDVSELGAYSRSRELGHSDEDIQAR